MRIALVIGTTFLAAGSPTYGADPIPRTANGRPDLSGPYDLARLTPMQRDAGLGERRSLTMEEAEQVEGAAAARMERADSLSDPDREAPPAGGAAAAGAAPIVPRDTTSKENGR